MTSDSKVYLAGVGFSPSQSKGSSPTASLVSAATKALLDAGVTYDDVTRGTVTKGSSDGSKAFKAFDSANVPVDQAGTGSELTTSFSRIQGRGEQCVLMIATEKSGTTAFVLISENFLWRHAYLKDSAISVRKSQSGSTGNAKDQLKDVCQTVWTLRGWSNTQNQGRGNHQASYKGKSSESFEFSRADGDSIPKWEDVEHRQDGKHRLGYNPATKTKEISLEDFVAVQGFKQQQKKADDGLGFKRKGGDRAALARL